MKCEPLKDKKQQLIKKCSLKNKDKKTKKDFHEGFEKGVDDSFDLFANFIELYKRYKNDVKLLMNEQKNVWSKWVKHYENQSKVDSNDYLNLYNEWLFNFVFSDIKGEDDSFLKL